MTMQWCGCNISFVRLKTAIDFVSSSILFLSLGNNSIEVNTLCVDFNVNMFIPQYRCITCGVIFLWSTSSTYGKRANCSICTHKNDEHKCIQISDSSRLSIKPIVPLFKSFDRRRNSEVRQQCSVLLQGGPCLLYLAAFGFIRSQQKIVKPSYF